MGTRNITAVMVNGEYKVAQYGQWDGYPSGQGKTILDFLRSLTKEKKKRFVKKVKAVKELTEEENQKQWVECGADPDNDMVGFDVSKIHTEKYPESSRDTGGKILSIIMKRKAGILLNNKIDFVTDSLFCEWAYVVDLDDNTFEVFKGFNQMPLHRDERFATFSDQCREDYYPVKLVKKYDLDNLPTVPEMVKELDGEEDES